MKKYKFYSDAGHGWLAVKRRDLVDLNILNMITDYSYQKGKTVYLEEDCDAGLFAERYKAKFGQLPEYETKNINGMSSIRNYERFHVEGYFTKTE